MSTARKQHRFKTGQVDKNIAESLGKREASAARKEGLKLLNGKSGPAAGLMVSKTLRQAAVIPIENLMPDPAGLVAEAPGADPADPGPA
jgi:hypothetical protein